MSRSFEYVHLPVSYISGSWPATSRFKGCKRQIYLRCDAVQLDQVGHQHLEEKTCIRPHSWDVQWLCMTDAVGKLPSMSLRSRISIVHRDEYWWRTSSQFYSHVFNAQVQHISFYKSWLFHILFTYWTSFCWVEVPRVVLLGRSHF